MSATPINPELLAPRQSAPPAESERWKCLLDALLPQRPIELAKQADMVRLTRSYEPDLDGKGGAIWTKTYQNARNGDSGRADLNVFNAWERTLIVKAHEDGLEGCYRLYQLVEKGTGIHVGDTPLELRKSRSSVIKTHHAGSDLDIWRLMRPWSKGEKLEHPFVQQQHFLKLMRGVLFALHGFHCKRFVHCDLHPGNIVLPAEVRLLSAAHGQGERYELRALWDQIKLIDLGYSIHKGIEPPAMLPLALWELGVDDKKPLRDAQGRKMPSRRMSRHLHERLKTLDAIAANWPESERYSRTRWEAQQEQLNILQSLDWREDLYQLGHWLTRIRDGDEDSCWGGVHYMGDPVDVRAVNTFIRDFPQQLMDWGDAPGLPAEMPHVEYIARIDTLLRQLPAVPDSFILRRRDMDTAYRTYLDVLTQQSIAAQENALPRPEGAPAEAIAHEPTPAPDQSAWSHVCNLDTAAAYAYYLREWPQGAWVNQARERRQACLAQETQASGRAPARLGARRGAQLALVGLVATVATLWYGWQTPIEAKPVERAAAPAVAPVAPVALAAPVVPAASSVPVAPAAAPAFPAAAASATGPVQRPVAVAMPVAVAAHHTEPLVAATPEPAPDAAAAPALSDDKTRLAAYLARTVAVEQSDWWLKGRSQGIKASDEQSAWVRETFTHAEQDHWPRAQFALAGLYCSGAYPELAPLSSQRCGAWRAAALSNARFTSELTSNHERDNMVGVVVTEFDDMVLGYWQGKFHNAAPQTEFANALLSGLQALQAQYPGLALRAAYVQACTFKPLQRAAASQTLRLLQRQHPGSREAMQAATWLSAWRVGDYRRCRKDGP